LDRFKATLPGTNKHAQFFLPNTVAFPISGTPFARRTIFIISRDQIVSLHNKKAVELASSMEGVPSFDLLELDYVDHPVRFFLVHNTDDWVSLGGDDRFTDYTFETRAAR
jgi:hypothetical protein